MKKLFLSLAFMLIGSFAFANNSSDLKLNDSQMESFKNRAVLKSEINQDLLGTCYVTFSAYDEEGSKLATWTLQFDDVASEADCDQISDIVEEALTKL